MMEFNRPCRLCWNKESVHACPKCNISYCSLSCYQSHSNDCTEAFYKDNVENQLKSGNSIPEKERQKMAELVQKEINKIVTGEISFKSEENHETDSESDIFDKEMTGKMERMAEEENFDFGEFSEKEQNRFFNAVNSGLLNSSVIEWIPWWKSYFPQLQNGKTDIPKKILVIDHQRNFNFQKLKSLNFPIF
ncbi:hypothetical protein MHBO_002633 [Bonamia ostreae]|uniref:HIT-type domain-containing protein n=1 Tax=Bonamia ostreae TaxID=126728 RepID=A0ABV2AN15_9EUKA